MSIVVPCYNEEKNIPLILERFSQSIINRTDIEVILVNNGSTDKSEQVMSQVLPEYLFAKKVNIPINQGYGYGVLTGLREAKGIYLGWTHADLQTDPDDVLRALEIIQTNGYPDNIYVKGNRKNRHWFDRLFTSGMSLFESIYLSEKLNDINAQPNVFHKNFFDSWLNPPHDFSLDLFALYKARKASLNLVRFDVMFPDRIHGQSSWNTGLSAKWKFIKRTLIFSKNLKREMNK